MALAPHLRELVESWFGGFARNQDDDRVIMERLNLAPNDVQLVDFKVNGHTVTYTGRDAMTFRVEEGNLVAFAGAHSNEITIDGTTYKYAEQPLGLVSWAPIEEERRGSAGALVQIRVHGEGEVFIPVPGNSGDVELVAEGSKIGSRGEVIASHLQDGVLTFTNTAATSARWLFVVPK